MTRRAAFRASARLALDWIGQMRRTPFARALNRRLRAQRDGAADVLRDPGVDLAITCDACPVLIAGTVDGAHLYFRARSGGWRCAIDPDEETAQRAGRFLPPDAAQYCAEGDDPDDGWMPHTEAWRIVREAIEAWRAQRERP